MLRLFRDVVMVIAIVMPATLANANPWTDALAKQQGVMNSLANNVQTGTYFSNVEQPSDGNAFRNAMLATVNACRSHPAECRANNGSYHAPLTDLTPKDTFLGDGSKMARTVWTGGGVSFDVGVNANANAPYLDPVQLDSGLNEMAQFMAEYNATLGRPGHDGPAKWNGVSMVTLSERAAYFKVSQSPWEAGGYSVNSAHSPVDWLQSNTHFRPFLNMQGNPGSEQERVSQKYEWTVYKTTKVGFGAAKSPSGEWSFIAVGDWVNGQKFK